MSFALQPTSIIPILVTTDWTDANNAATDLITTLETSFPGVWGFPAEASIIFALLYGKHTGVLGILTNTVTGLWLHAVVPTIGEYAYLISMG
jgi:hypothetical protein